MIKITKAQLLGVIRQACTEDSRFAMRDVLFTPEEMVATDGRAIVKMRYGKFDGKEDPPHWHSFHIKRNVLVRIAAGMRAADFLILSKVQEKKIVFRHCRWHWWQDNKRKRQRKIIELTSISTKPNTEGRFPDYEAVLTHETKHVITMDRLLLIDLLRNLEGENVELRSPVKDRAGMTIIGRDTYPENGEWKSFGAIMPLTPEPVE